MIHQLYDYPPYPFLQQVLDHCPKSGYLYLNLWKNRDKDNKIQILKKDIQNEYLISPIKFRNDLLHLCREALVSIDETPNSIYIELTDWEEEVERHSIC